MLRGIYTSASGMLANSHVQQMVGNNLSNVNTVGYRAQDAQLSPFARAFLGRTGPSAMTGGAGARGFAPMGSSALGTRIAGTSVSEETGRIERTDRPTDCALDGPGYFAAEIGDDVGLTRAGNFRFTEDGYLCTESGHRLLGLEGPIRVGEGDVRIESDGGVISEGQQVGVLAVVVPREEEGLVRDERAGFLRLEGRGGAEMLESLEDRTDTSILGGHLEFSNVDLVDEMTRMMTTLRSYGSNHTAFRIQDEATGEAIRMTD
ncbi:MAG: flagellar hook-basal body protein, partial [Bacillota bacterium]